MMVEGRPRWVPELGLRYEKILLDSPRKDFSTGRPGSGGYFCTGQERKEGIPGQKPGVPIRAQFSGRQIARRRPAPVEARWEKQSVLPCPRSSPWILNTVYLRLRGCLIRLRWGPNYADPFMGMYVEISMGLYVIWAASRHMYRELVKRETRSWCYVIENQKLDLRADAWENPPDADQVPVRVVGDVVRQLHTTRSHVVKVELTTGGGHPLYAAITSASENGVSRRSALGDLWALSRGGNGRFGGPPQGPLPKGDYDVITSWKWVWRGLDPKIRPPRTPIYEKLLKGRIRRLPGQKETCAPVRIITTIIPPREKKPAAAEPANLRKIWIYTVAEGWTSRCEAVKTDLQNHQSTQTTTAQSPTTTL